MAQCADVLDAFYRGPRPRPEDVPTREVSMSGTIMVSIALDSGWSLQLQDRVVDDDDTTNFSDHADVLESLTIRARAALLDKTGVTYRDLGGTL